VLHDVHFLQLPVPLFVRSQEQFEALLREFTMISLGHPEDDDLPQRMLALMAGFMQRFPHIIGGPEERIRAAAEAGIDVIDDLVYPTETEGAPAAAALLRLLEETDAYCMRVNEMLVLAQDPEAVRLRTWFLTSFVDQVAGKPPVPWPDWS
jgi:hypothetical protein